MHNENLDKIISLICNSNKKICLFLGAGADISSGGKSFLNVKKETISKFSEHNPEFLKEHIINQYFEETIDSPKNVSFREAILSDINESTNIKISDGYKFLVLLAKYGFIDAIITTNFYDYLEKAQQEMGMDVFDVFSNNDNKNLSIPNIYPQKTLYLKIHGDVNRKYVSHITTEEINSKSYPKALKNILREYLKNDLVIFVGYSGLDTMVTDLIKPISRNMETTFWINPSYNNDSELISLLSHNLVLGKYSFDDFVIRLGLKKLNNINCEIQDSTFIYTWVKAKTHNSISPILKSTKVNIERAELSELKKSNKICVISGKAGIGKTYLIEHYIKHSSKNDILYIKLNYDPNVPIILTIIDKLGFTTNSPFSLLYNLCNWYLNQKKYLTFIIDEIPEEINQNLEEFIAFVDVTKFNKNISFILLTRGSNIKNKLSSSLLNLSVTPIEMKLFNEDNVKELAECYDVQKYVTKLDINYLLEPFICDLVFSFISKPANTHDNIFNVIETALSERYDKNPQTFHDELILIAQAEYTQNALEKEKIEYLFDSGLISSISPHYYKHEAFKSYYLSRYLFRNQLEKKKCIKELINIFETKQTTDTLFYHACVMHYTILEDNSDIIQRLLELNKIIEKCCNSISLKFCKTCLIYFAEKNSKEFYHSLKDIKESLSEEMVKLIIESTQVMLNDEFYYKTLFLFQENTPFAYESVIYSIDRFCEKVSIMEINNEESIYFEEYFDFAFSGCPSIKLYKILYALMRTKYEKKEYRYANKLHKILYETIGKCSIEEIMNVLRKYSYNILFNADDIEADFNAISQTDELIQLVYDVLNGKILDVKEYTYLIDITNDINNMCIFMLSNLIVVQSMTYDKKAILSAAIKIINTRNDLAPQNIDFLLSSIFMSLYYLNPHERKDFIEFFEMAYDKYEMLLFEQPTNIRKSTSKRFSQEFEQIFEDGFNPLAFLFYTSNLEDDENRLNQYWSMCEQLCKSGNINKILKVVHAIGQMISLFPREGFLALQRVAQYRNHDIIKRGIIRVLQESSTRYPIETELYIEQNTNFNDIDLIQPYEKVKDTMIRSRTLEQLHWSRLLYSFKSMDYDIIRVILQGVTKTNTLSVFILKLLNQDNI